ncbi:MAG: TolC family outer membrane protein [Beijerinckiaceae bacterium]
MSYRVQSALTAVGLAALLATAAGGASRAETVDGALARAYGSNPTLNAQRAALRATDENVPQALSGYRPRLNATGDAGVQTDRNRNPVVGAINQDYLPRGVSLTVDQIIWNGNRTPNSVSQAESQVFAGRETLRNIELQVLLDAVTAYMNVLRDTAVLGVRRSNVEVIEEQLRQVRDRFAVGEVTRTDVAQSESRLALAKSQAATSEALLKASLATYRQRIGAEAKVLAPARPLDRLMPRTQEAGIQLGLRTHPLISAAMHSVDAALLAVKVIEGELYPSLSVRGILAQRYDLQAPDIDRGSAAIVGNLTIPIYEGGQVYSRVRQAKETLGQQRITVDVIRDQVRQAVMAGWGQYEATKLQVLAAQAQVQAAEIALAGVREEAKVGQRTTLDVLNSQQELAEGRVQLITAQRDRVVATYNLLAATGQLSAKTLALRVDHYDSRTHFNQVRDKWVGLDTPGGR